MFARDGYPLKVQMHHKKLNYKLVLRAAHVVMSSKDYTLFSAQMDRAFKDPDKSCQANCFKIVESFCFSAETLMNTIIRDIKVFVNCEIAGVNGPAPPYAELMGSVGRAGKTKCILWSFGTQPNNKGPTFRHGLMPLTKADYPNFPFTAGSDKKNWPGTISMRVESFHNAVGSLRCFDATKSSPDKKPHFDWWDANNSFISGVRRDPQYTELFWVLFLKAAVNLGDAGKEIVEANKPEEIDNLRLRKVKVVSHDGNDFTAQEIPLISDDMRAMIDNICYMGVYCHKTMFERLSVTRRTAFREHTLKMARDFEDEFYTSWKSYRAEHPSETVVRTVDEDSECERLMNLLADGDDGAGAAGAAGAD
uniref:Uncharacterized protein n=1 Tax=Cryptomonas curvata TaxID=233186 RepID=A0A7S0MVG4_9CRYP|mmetsp:Transcript_53332/g.111331  ORF Transcript_53332/g.111331 Transcript_53332/m.111331 type:complete len:364 (+) Transcript_53332:515-1606(+)